MTVCIRPISSDDIEAVVHLSLAAWEPVFRSFSSVLGAEIYGLIYPNWTKSQAEAVESVCRDTDKYVTWVAEEDGVLAGFVACTFNLRKKVGEVEMLAVLPDRQNRGIGTQLNNFALNQMIERGMNVAVVGTGGDPSHAPARRSYEKAGYTALPIVRYYKALRP